MRWWIASAGLLLTALFCLLARRKAPASYRDAPLEDGLPAYLSVLAASPGGRLAKKLRLPPGFRRRFEKGARFLLRLSEEELSPASRLLCESARFVQEEIVSLRRELRTVGPLPADREGAPQVLRFARETLGRSNAELRVDRLEEALAAWQHVRPMTERELQALRPALRLALLQLLLETERVCLTEQRSQARALRARRLLQQKKERRAMRLFRLNRHDPAFLERLMREWRAACSEEQILWLERYFNRHELSARRLAENEQRRQTDDRLWADNALRSLRLLARLPWERLAEEWSLTHAALQEDPVYPRMDAPSRAFYRRRVFRISRESGKTELTVCQAALSLARSVKKGDSFRAQAGCYLVGDGQRALYRFLAADRRRLPLPFLLRSRASLLLRLASFGFFFLSLFVFSGVSGWLRPLFSLVLLLACRRLFLKLYRLCGEADATPRIRLERLGDGERVLAVCHAVLSDASQAMTAVKRLAVLHAANPDPNLHFLLLGDFQDSLTASMPGDEEIVSVASAALRALREDAGRFFFYFQRERVFQPSEHVHMGRERKNGALETALRLLDGQPVEDTFAYASLPPEKLKGAYRYVFSLDEDVFLPPGVPLKAVGAMLHPLQKSVGISALQPRLETDAPSEGSRFALLLDDLEEADGLSSPEPELLQAAPGGFWQGNGLLEPSAFLRALQEPLPPCAFLRRELPDGELAGCAFAPELSLRVRRPQTLQEYLLRLHRRTRGDWQLLPLALPFPFFAKGKGTRRTLPPAGRRKLFLDLLRSLEAPARTLLLLVFAFQGKLWPLLAALLLPEAAALFPPSRRSLGALGLRLATLPLRAAVQMDAVGRALYRLLFSRQNLLQWASAPLASSGDRRPPMLSFVLSMSSAGILAGLLLLSGKLFLPGWLLAGLWALLPFFLPLLESPCDAPFVPTDYMREVGERLAAGSLSCLEAVVPGEAHGLPADGVQLEPDKGLSPQVSPSGAGLYLLALLALERMGRLPASEAIKRVSEAIDSLEALPKWKGLFYSRYQFSTLEPLPPRFVPSVENGLIAACLLCCAQGVRTLARECTDDVLALAARLDGLAKEMDLSALFDNDGATFFIGRTPELPREEPERHALFSGEVRLLAFVSIVLGRLSPECWRRMERAALPAGRGRALLAPFGSMLEYMLPLLFHPPLRGSSFWRAQRAALRKQRARRLGGAFGLSECDCYAFDPELRYLSRPFGLPSLALSPDVSDDAVTPYATLLALPLDPKGCFQNLLKLQTLGLEGPMGFFEAADFSRARIPSQTDYQLVRSCRTSHQGMIVVSLCNFLCQRYIADLFWLLPGVQAFRGLLEEPPREKSGGARRPLRRRARSGTEPTGLMEREAKPLRFPIDAHLLHGAGTVLLVDAQGGGYLARRGLLWTRFSENGGPPGGVRLYLRDSQSGAFWDLCDPRLQTSARFETAQAAFCSQRDSLRAVLRMFVNPLDGAVLHCVDLENLSSGERMLEICSYLEPVLLPWREGETIPDCRDDLLRVEKLPPYGVKAVGRNGMRLWHILCADAPPAVFHFQSDRRAFLGRGRTVYAPRALDRPVGSQADAPGERLEPCLSLRAQFTLSAGGKTRFAFATLSPGENEPESAFVQRYDRPDSALRRYASALTRGLVSAKHFDLSPQEQSDVSRLVGPLCYTGQPHQALFSGFNELPLSALQTIGLDGGVPILLLECAGERGVDLAKLLLKAHSLLRTSGLCFQLVVVAQGGAELLSALDALCRKSPGHELLHQKGGVSLLERERLSEEQFRLLRAAARLVLRSDAGLREQLEALASPLPRPAFFYRPDVRWKNPLPPGKELAFFNGYGGFTPDEGDYVVLLPPGRQTPAPWRNPLCSQAFGTLAGESGLLFSYAGDVRHGLLTRRPVDDVCPTGGENFFLRDESNGLLWSIVPAPLGRGLSFRTIHAPGETIYESAGYGVSCRLCCFTDLEAPLGVRTLLIKNEGPEERVLRFFHTCVFQPGPGSAAQLCAARRIPGGLALAMPDSGGYACLWGADPEPELCASMSPGEFNGLWGVSPSALSAAEPPPNTGGNVCALRYSLRLKSGESRSLLLAVGFFKSFARMEKALASFRADGATLRLRRCRQRWERRLGGLCFDLPDPILSLLCNRWIPYQTLASRLLMQGVFSPGDGPADFSGGLQDMLALMHASPEVVRDRLLHYAALQFEEDDVESPSAPGDRSVGDALFLPFITAVYVQIVGDAGILKESVPYLRQEPTREEKEKRPPASAAGELSEPLLSHCVRAIDRVRLGERGLPLVRVGASVEESVWTGLFLCETLRRFLPLVGPDVSRRFANLRLGLLASLERCAWDGSWYLRGYRASGERADVSSPADRRLESDAQSWAVFAGLSRERCAAAMESVWRLLYEPESGIFKPYAPPPDGESPAFPPDEEAVRATRSAVWAMAAFHQLGWNDRAWELAFRLLPAFHSATRQAAERYRAEPYVLAGEVRSEPFARGTAGQSWYTESAAWFLFVLLEELLGFRKTGASLRFRPVLPEGWNELRLTYRYGSAVYRLRALRSCGFPTADGSPLPDGRLPLRDDGRIHEATFPALPPASRASGRSL